MVGGNHGGRRTGLGIGIRSRSVGADFGDLNEIPGLLHALNVER